MKPIFPAHKNVGMTLVSAVKQIAAAAAASCLSSSHQYQYAQTVQHHIGSCCTKHRQDTAEEPGLSRGFQTESGPECVACWREQANSFWQECHE